MGRAGSGGANLNMARLGRRGMQKGVRPVSYELEFEPDLAKSTFAGAARIKISCERAVSEVVLDAAELSVGAVRAEAAEPARDVPARARLEPGREALVVSLGEAVRGELVVTIEYTGTLNDRLLGFYRSDYVHRGKKMRLATTQFEAADARRAFPCFDEPAAKATFDISIVTNGANTAISNMPVASRERLGGRGRTARTRYTFMTTPVMSTYLVYLGVGEFEFIGGTTPDGVAIRVATTPGNSRHGRYALGLAKELLGMYGRYFGSRYPLPKLDLVALPDFAAGAMENWGAITFREAVLLYDPRTSSTRTRQFIAEVVSHEIAHQWFGNLVTMRWWNDLWLNESFATFMATKFVDRLRPEWDMWDQFAGDAMAPAMALDALRSTHPIDVKVASPAEIREIFDAISYDKGGCILRMVEGYVGEAAFRKGLRRYLKEHAYGNASGADLWDAVGEASGLPVGPLVQAWIGREGFPVVEVSRGRGGALRLRQERFTYEEEEEGRQQGGAGRSEKDSKAWPIPITVGPARGGGGSRARQGGPILLSRGIGMVAAPKGGGGGAVVNYGRRGFYRVQYDQAMMLDIRHAVAQGSIPPIDRWAVHNDMYALCVAGRLTLREYLDMVDAYADDDSYMACADISASLRSLLARTYREEHGAVIAWYARRHFERMLGRLGWDASRSERHTDALLRGQAVSALGMLGDGEVVAEARSRFDSLERDGGPLPADLVDAVYSAVAWNDPRPRTFSRLVSLYREAPSQEEKVRIMGGGMASFSDGRLLRRALDFSLGGEVRSQNMHVVAVRAAANPHGAGVVWPWLRSNWRAISSKVGRGNPLLSRIVSCLPLPGAGPSPAAAGAAGRGGAHYKAVARFFEANTVPGTERAVEQALERMRINAAFMERVREELAGGAGGGRGAARGAARGRAGGRGRGAR